METLEHQYSDLEVNPLTDWQPVKITQNRRDVIIFPGFGDEPLRCILNGLKLLKETGGDSSQQTITVIQSTADEGLYLCLGCVLVE